MVLTHWVGLSAGQLKSVFPNASSRRPSSATIGTPGSVSRKWTTSSRRSRRGAPCPNTTTPTRASERARFRAAREPSTEMTGCPSDWRISSRADNKLEDRNSICTIVLMVFRDVSLGTVLRRDSARPWVLQVETPKFWQQPLCQDHMATTKTTRQTQCMFILSYLLNPSLRRKIIIGHQFVNPD